MTTVAEFAGAAGVELSGVVRWGQPVPEHRPGVYVVATTHDPAASRPAYTECPLSREAVDELLAVRPELRIDGERPTPADLEHRLAAIWPADEPVVYVGLAGASLSKRIDQYYRTPLGARRPHAGGWPLKTLSILDELWVHWAPADDPPGAELAMLDAFVEGLPGPVRQRLHDAALPPPFANLERTKRERKRHGMTGAREPAGPSRRAAPPLPTAPPPSAEPSVKRPQGPLVAEPARLADEPRSQPVTAVDMAAGRVRLPADAKPLFPHRRGEVRLSLRGTDITAPYDPRDGPDRARSAVLRIDRGLLEGIVKVGERLAVRVVDGRVRLG